MVLVKKIRLNVILLIKRLSKKMQKINTETCQKMKKKPKENMKEIDLETSKNVKSKLNEY